MQKVVIIGGGPAGRLVLHALHGADPAFDVTLIKDEPVNVNRCAVPYGIPDTKPVDRFCIPNALVTDFGAELVVGSAASLDTAASRVVMTGGQAYPYDHLVLATGARPVMPPIPGADLTNIVSVRSRTDMEQLRGFAKTCRRGVIVGGGYIGIEVAVVMKELGLDITIVEMEPHVLLTTTEDDFAVAIEAHLEEKGVRIVGGARATAFTGKGGAAHGVVLDNGETLPADFVVVSIGVRPNAELAAAAGLATSRFGIVTNEYLQTSVPSIYASGDCAEKKSFVTGKPTAGEFGTNAVLMSRVVAANIRGRRTKFPGVINANASCAFDYSFGTAGLIAKAAVREGMDHVTGNSTVMDRYPMMDGVSHIRTRLVFARASRKLLGGSVLRKGHGAAGNVDFISLAIQMGATIDDLLTFQYATHPELAAKPSDNTWLFAAQDAVKRL